MSDKSAAEQAASNEDTEELTLEQQHSQLVGRLLSGQDPELSNGEGRE